MTARPNIDIAERLPGVSLNDQQDVADEAEPAQTLDNREDLQKALIGAIRRHGSASSLDARGAVQSARDARNYMRGMQRFAWSEDAQDVVFSDESEPYDRVFNITQAYAKIFISTFMGAQPKVEPEADNPFESDSVQDAAKARDYERIWRKRNDMARIQMEIGRLLFTDGRIITQTRQTENGELTLTFGALESRVSGTANDASDWTMLQTENEYPLVKLKRKYPKAKKKLSSGSGDSYFRNARLAVKRKQATDTVINVDTGEDGTGLGTVTYSYLTPDFYEHLNDNECLELGGDEDNEGMYPSGVCVVHSGDVYLESFPIDGLSEFDVIHAIPADGMNGPAITDPLMNVQDTVNTCLNLTEETFDHEIPTTYWAQETNIDTLNNARNIPGGSRKMQLSGDRTAAEHFFVTPSIQPSAQLLEYTQQMLGQFAQFVTGLPPAIQGFGDANQKTSSGQHELRQMALGQMAIVWKPFTSWYTREMTRCVKLAAQRTDPIQATLDPLMNGAQRRNVSIAPQELRGFKFTNASDENFPETYTERRNAFMALMQDPDTKLWVMQSPDNLYQAKKYIGLPDLVIPGEDSRNKQLQEIAEMEKEEPIPDPQQMPEQMMPQVGQVPPAQPLTSSVPISKYDNDEIEEAECLRWINSVQGQEARRVNPAWFDNVCLHCDLHTAQKQQKAAANAPKPEEKPPSINVSVPLDKFSPEIQTQLFGMFGVNVTQPPVSLGENNADLGM